MDKIAFKDFERIMLYDVSKKQDPCIEIEFCVDRSVHYHSSWLGKMLDSNTKKPVYWFGLVHDGSEAYDFDSFELFVNAKIFNGNSIKDIWGLISLVSIDGGQVFEVLPLYV